MGRTRLFDGISVPLLTPFKEDSSINFEEYEHLLEYVIAGGIAGIFVGGTTGEFVNLNIEERRELLQKAAEINKKRVSVLFNVTALNVKDIEVLVEFAHTYGADAVSVTPPFYHSYDQTALKGYFQKIARIADPLPLYLYNIPGMAKNSISPGLLNELFAENKNIRGIKDSSMDFMTFLQFQLAAPDDTYEIITGNDAQVLTALQAGGHGAVIAMANVVPELCVSVYQNYFNGKLNEARENQIKILKLRELVRSVMPIMSHKAMLETKGFNMGGARFPLRDLTDLERKKVTEEFRAILSK